MKPRRDPFFSPEASKLVVPGGEPAPDGAVRLETAGAFRRRGLPGDGPVPTSAAPGRAGGMRIAYLTTGYASASDTFRRGEVRELRARHHDVHTFSLRRPGSIPAGADDVRREQATTDYLVPDRVGGIVAAVLIAMVTRPAGVARAVVLAWRTRPPGLLGMLRTATYLGEAAYLAREIARRRLEHLHCAIGGASASVAMLAAELGETSYSLTLHGMRDYLEPRYWALREKVARSSFTACISHFGVSQCMLSAPVDAWSKLHVVRVAPSPPFREAARIPPPSAPRLLWIGRMSEEKGLPLLLDAVARVAATVADVEVTLVGDGPLGTAVEAQAARLGITDRVVRRGWCTTEGVMREIDRARCVVVSSFGEGIPTVIIEAFSRERPVVASRIAGIPELVEDGRSGWLVPPGSTDHLAAALLEAVTTDPERIARMGRHGAARVQAQHDLQVEVGKLEDLLREAVACRSRAR